MTANYCKYLVGVAILALAGCATFNVDKDYAFAGKTGTGLVVLSLTHSTPAATIDYRSLGGNKTGAFMTGNVQDKMDWDRPKGRLVVAELPVGQYEIHQWRSGHANVTYTSKPFSIPFTVTQGKAVYIGNVFLDINELTGLYRVSVVDRGDRDIALLLERYKKLNQSDVVKGISKVNQAP